MRKCKFFRRFSTSSMVSTGVMTHSLQRDKNKSVGKYNHLTRMMRLMLCCPVHLHRMSTGYGVMFYGDISMSGSCGQRDRERIVPDVVGAFLLSILTPRRIPTPASSINRLQYHWSGCIPTTCNGKQKAQIYITDQIFNSRVFRINQMLNHMFFLQKVTVS